MLNKANPVLAVIVAVATLSLFTSKPCPPPEQTNADLIALAQTQQANIVNLATTAAKDSQQSAKAYEAATQALVAEKKRLSQQGCTQPN